MTCWSLVLHEACNTTPSQCQIDNHNLNDRGLTDSNLEDIGSNYWICKTKQCKLPKTFKTLAFLHIGSVYVRESRLSLIVDPDFNSFSIHTWMRNRISCRNETAQAKTRMRCSVSVPGFNFHFRMKLDPHILHDSGSRVKSGMKNRMNVNSIQNEL